MEGVFVFDTAHHALWAEEVARELEVPVEVIPAPPGARARCNLALQTFPEYVPRVVAALVDAAVPFAIYTWED